MRATFASLMALVVMVVVASNASAYGPYPCIPQAPDACGPGYYIINNCNLVYGPNYNLYPPFLQWQGAVLAPQCNPNAGCGYGGNPYIRSPRDYFMLEGH